MAIDSQLIKTMVSKELHRIRTLHDIAQLLGTTPESLRKQFARRERTTLSQYIAETRIERVKQLLRESNLECKQICFSVGFSRAEIGSRVFKQHAGFSMEEFRREWKQR